MDSLIKKIIGFWGLLLCLVSSHSLLGSNILPHEYQANRCHTLIKLIALGSGTHLSLKHLTSATEEPALSVPEIRSELLQSMKIKARNIFKNIEVNSDNELVIFDLLTYVDRDPTNINRFVTTLNDQEKFLLTEILFNFLRFYHEASTSSYRNLGVIPSTSRITWIWQLSPDDIQAIFSMLQEKGYDTHLIDSLENFDTAFTTTALRKMLFRVTPEDHLRRLGLMKDRLPIVYLNAIRKKERRPLLYLSLGALAIGGYNLISALWQYLH